MDDEFSAERQTDQSFIIEGSPGGCVKIRAEQGTEKWASIV